MYVPEKKPLFRKPRFQSNPFRVAIMIGIVLLMLMVLRNLNIGRHVPHVYAYSHPNPHAFLIC